ncbi:peptidylprolyl isomerase [Campylobacter geochelonis]|uniref:Putative periplasmic protein n=1 Tax=Campylobacter geochelonis TaxID=1780362 RepID=A0A128EMA4_9BACT|nr:peptidylprolyl isomerase [Campylobacter geochelonis]QKF72078.1 putative chaperone (SurA domain) [Campylobacter geochelonis]CZE45859.1 putative periplasmic protein [Campylobacter geochelonis]CZE46778.1 putative periplasmic protein [Campylobacter geochelonis]CZE49833.1 putative periplasmic protein [Campylobacter geochelonis]
MKKRLVFVSFLLSFSLAQASMVNWVVALVNNQPITNYEVFDTMKKIGGNERNAIEFLIKEKLQIAEIKKRDITASPYEVTQRIEQTAQKNGMSVDEFKSNLAKEGINYTHFREEIAKSIKDQKFYESIFARVDNRITPQNVEQYYKQNIARFTTFDSVNVTRYADKNRAKIEELLAGKKPKNLYSQKVKIPRKGLSEQTAYVFASIKDGGFTPIVHNPQGYFEVFRIDSKVGLNQLSFEEAQNMAINEFVQKERRKAVDEYFEKLRAEAVVQFLPVKQPLVNSDKKPNK